MNSGKVRIYELSKELNLDNRDLLAVCEQLNISVKSHSSTITDSEAERIRAAAQKQVASRPASVKTTPIRQGHSQTSDSKGRTPAPVQKKQQILEIRKPTIRQLQSPEPPTPPSNSAPQPVVNQSVQQPPARPVAPSRPAPMAKPNEVEDEGIIPEEVSLPNDAPEDTDLIESVNEEFEPALIEAPVQPELAGPPARPNVPDGTSSRPNLSNRPVLKRSQSDQSFQEGRETDRVTVARDLPKPSQSPRGENSPAPKAPSRSPITNRADGNRSTADRPTLNHRLLLNYVAHALFVRLMMYPPKRNNHPIAAEN